MLGAQVSDYSARRAPRDHAGPTPTVLHLALTRSAAVRIAPVASALRGPQALVDPAGRVVEWSGTEPPAVSCEPLRSPAAVGRAAAAALKHTRPDVALVSGDDDAALACTLAALRADVPVARLGAGLRCGDRGSAREVNRIAIDQLATRLYTDGEVAEEHLLSEGVDERRFHRVGSTVPAVVGAWHDQALELAAWTGLGVRRSGYVLVSLHRRETFVDVGRLADAVIALAHRDQVVVCLDERSRASLEPAGHLQRLTTAAAAITGPLDYVEFLSLHAGAGAVLTDSATVQEESTVLGVACFTLARSSECSSTLTHGTTVLLGDDPAGIAEVRVGALDVATEPMPLWDGAAGVRVAADLQGAPWEDG